ncbi:MAG: hypothetical protein QRY74_02745 [Chlamydia sp.]
MDISLFPDYISKASTQSVANRVVETGTPVEGIKKLIDRRLVADTTAALIQAVMMRRLDIVDIF